jgi:26S proteasome regulatory subunit T5
MATLEEAVRADDLNAEILRASNEEVQSRTKLLDNEIKRMRTELARVQHEKQSVQERIGENQGKIKMNRQLPYLVGNVVEVRLRPCMCMFLCVRALAC